MASQFGQQALMQAEMHKRKLEAAKAEATSDSLRRRVTTSKRPNEIPSQARTRTSQSRRSHATGPSGRSQTSNRQHQQHNQPPPAMTANPRLFSQTIVTRPLNYMSQTSELTDHSSLYPSQSWIQESQEGLQSRQSIRSGSRSVPALPLGQPSFSSSAQSSIRFSQQSGGRSVMFNTVPSIAPPPDDWGVPLQRRGTTMTTTTLGGTSSRSSVRKGSAHGTLLPPPAPQRPSTNAQRLMMNLMNNKNPPPFQPCASTRPSFAQTYLQSSASQASGGTASSTSKLQQFSQYTHASVGKASTVLSGEQSDKKLNEMKALVGQFQDLVAKSTRALNDKEIEVLTKMEEKINAVDKEASTGLEAVDKKLQAVENKANSFRQAVEDSNHRHEARVRFYSNKSQELDGKIAEVTSIIGSERDAAVNSIKSTYDSVVTKIQDVGTDIANGLQNHPVASMIKSFWTEFQKAKTSTPSSWTHQVETSPTMDTRHRSPPSTNSTKSTHSTSLVSSSSHKTPSRSRNKSKHDRSILSPLKIVKNQSRPKRQAVDSSPASRISVVTPSNFPREFKRPKNSATASMAVAKRGRTKKSRSAFSHKNALSDDFGFLS